MTDDVKNRVRGFTLIELVIVIVVLGLLAAVAIPKYLNLTKEAEIASVESMVASLESAMSINVARQIVNGDTITVGNPFDNLANEPGNYSGVNDPVTVANTPNGTWSWRPSGNWIMYNPRHSITGGWLSGGERFAIYQVQTVLDNGEVVGLKLTTTPTYAYTW